MASNGYFDNSTGSYKALPLETWATAGDSAGYTWDNLTTWAGTASETVTFTTGIFDGGKIDFFNPTLLVSSSIPADITIRHGNTKDSSGGAIDSPTTVNLTPNTASVAGINARFFEFDITVTRDSATQADPEIFSVEVDLRNTLKTITEPDLDTSTLTGAIGLRELTLTNAGKIVSLICQPHADILNPDSSDESVTPIVYVDKTSTNPKLEIVDLDSYGKRRRVDCIVDVQATVLPLLQTDATGSIVEVND